MCHWNGAGVEKVPVPSERRSWVQARRNSGKWLCGSTMERTNETASPNERERVPEQTIPRKGACALAVHVAKVRLNGRQPVRHLPDFSTVVGAGGGNGGGSGEVKGLSSGEFDEACTGRDGWVVESNK